jgi:hypothetical protein
MNNKTGIEVAIHTWLGRNPQFGRPLSRIVVPLVYFFILEVAIQSYFYGVLGHR